MTILFEEDWDKYPSAIVDYETKNQEFVRLAALYREMGIPSAKFILALHNPELQGVDPFNVKTLEEAELVLNECSENFWYFIREIARDPAGSEDDPVMFIPNRGIIAAYWLYFNHVVFILIMIRQTGKSFGIDWLYTYLLNIGLTKSEISLLTKDERLRGRELERLKSMEITLPKYMKFRRKTDAGNTEVLRVSRLGNTFKAYVPNKSVKLADQIGRGMTSSNIGCDELAYVFNNFITVPIMLSASMAARELSRRKGEPYGTIFTTTSGKRDTPEGKYAYGLVASSAVFSEKFFMMKNREELYKAIRSASGDGETLRVNCTFNHRQLGKTDEWLRDRLRDSMNEDPIQIEADYLNLWPSGTIHTPFTKEIAQMMRDSEIPEVTTTIEGQDCYVLRWYYPEHELARRFTDVEHILAIDPSDAVGRDAIACIATNVYTGAVAMAATIAKTNLIHFAMWLTDFIEKHPKLTVIIERRGSGPTIIDYLLLYLPTRGIDPFRRLYNKAVQFADDYRDRFHEIQNPQGSRENLYSKYKDLFGWATSGSGTTSRNDLYSKTLSLAARLGGGSMHDRTLILQTLGLAIKNGRVDHNDGEHDDATIAWLLSYWLITLGRQLSHYGITANTLLRDNPAVASQRTLQNSYQSYVQEKAKDDIKRTTELLEHERDPFIIKRYEFELENAIAKLSTEDRQIISADDLIERLREKRKGLDRDVLQNLTNRGYGNYGFNNIPTSIVYY